MGEKHIDTKDLHMIGTQTKERIVEQKTCNAFSLYGIHMVGLSSVCPGSSFVHHEPAFTQLLITLAGRGQVWVNGQWAYTDPGAVYIQPSGAAHQYSALNADVVWEACWIIYTPLAQECWAIMPAEPALVRTEIYPLARAIEAVYQESIGLAEQTIMSSWVQLIHLYTLRLLRQVCQKPSPLQQVWDAVNNNLTHPWSNDELADLAGMSREHLRRLCQQSLACSPIKHVTILRMRHAAVLLAHEAYSIEEVAQRVGYENPLTFSTSFKRYMGIAPSIYRSQRLAVSAC